MPLFNIKNVKIFYYNILFISCFINKQIMAFNSERENLNIVVIRPKFFIQSQKFELSMFGSKRVNESFLNTFLLGFSGTYNFSEYAGLEIQGAKGIVNHNYIMNRLKIFTVDTDVEELKYLFSSSFLFSPAYGKFQINRDIVIYINTYFVTGFVFSCMNYNKSNYHDIKLENGFLIGIGQRVFYKKWFSFMYSLRSHIYKLKPLDIRNTESIDNNKVSKMSYIRADIFFNVGCSFYI